MSKKPKKGSNPDIFNQYRDKRLATTRPVASVSQLKGVWNRTFSVYRIMVVRVTARKGSRVTFEFVQLDGRGHEVPRRQSEQDATRKRRSGSFTVDLDDGDVAWGDLPSTAQLVDLSARPLSKKGAPPTVGLGDPPPEDIAYLGLTDWWLERYAPDAAGAQCKTGSVKVPSCDSL